MTRAKPSKQLVDYKSLFQSSGDDGDHYIFRNVLIHMAGLR